VHVEFFPQLFLSTKQAESANGPGNASNVKLKISTLSSTARQKDGLIGSPYTRIWDGSSPRMSALLATSVEGQ
jgi:hypothetical protein